MVFGFGKGKGQALDDDKQKKLEEALKGVTHPAFDQDVVALEWIGAAEEKKGTVTLEVVLPTLALTGRDELLEQIQATAKEALGADDVELTILSNVLPAAGSGKEQQAIVGVQNIVLVASGKGGVGKSTVAANLAVALGQLGCKVGLLDADVYGPSVPTMLGVADGARPGTVPGPTPNKPVLVPLDRHGVKLMSMGFLVDTDTPMVWRGPMIASASMQMFRDVSWGELDYLVVDLPPGTGDIHLTISQQILVTGAVIVSTPQDVALADVIRAKAMFDKVDIPSIGLIENMSYFICDGCDKRHEIFSHGGAKQAADKLHIPFIGEIPLEPSVRTAGDEGAPAVVSHPGSASAAAFTGIAQTVATQLAVQAQKNTGSLGPKITISGTAGGAEKPKGSLPIL
jgi:ATP-binding protein involved in chromosome partitioning